MGWRLIWQIPTFYLGTHDPGWLSRLDIPLFISRRRLFKNPDRKRFPRARAPWVMDCGGFTELRTHGGWSITADRFIIEVERVRESIGNLQWVPCMDWMCEPSMIAKTGKSVVEHQALTIENFMYLRERLGAVVAPVVQGWELDDYLRHVEDYRAVGVDLYAEPIVGVGSICRRDQDAQITAIMQALAPLKMHAFGVRGRALLECREVLRSADSMAWSFDARYANPLPGCFHGPYGTGNCANCIRYAVRWYADVVGKLNT